MELDRSSQIVHILLFPMHNSDLLFLYQRDAILFLSLYAITIRICICGHLFYVVSYRAEQFNIPFRDGVYIGVIVYGLLYISPSKNMNHWVR